MAIMIPSNPEFTDQSHEKLIFDALSKLPPNYYVLSSLRLYDPESTVFKKKKETEIDFVVLSPEIGCVVIEAKSGKVSFTSTTTYYEGEEIPPYTFVYESGKPMAHGGPFNQALTNKWMLKEYIKEDESFSGLANKQNYYSCVWFQQLTKSRVDQIKKIPQCPKGCILSKEDLNDPLAAIKRVVEIERKADAKDPWNKEECRQIINNVLAPTMDLAPGKNWAYISENEKMSRLLDDQIHVLDYLSEQREAVISGAAGTGKTLLALAKAKRESKAGNKVLFLCYNKALKDHLGNNYKEENIDFFTLDGLACYLCNTKTADYGALEKLIKEQANNEVFPYDAVIVDEAQDFGTERADNAEINILRTLKDIMLVKDKCFYAFYDKNQVVNSAGLPDYIVNADCKLSLYKNCRNTTKIAEASVAPIKMKLKMKQDCFEGVEPSFFFANKNEQLSMLIDVVNEISKEYKDIVVLSVKAYEKTSIYEQVNGQKIKIGGKTIPFYTVRQFKGLEADAIILIDVDADTFKNNKEKLLYYVGSSRAKFSLSIISSLTSDECEPICSDLLGGAFFPTDDYREELEWALHVKCQMK